MRNDEIACSFANPWCSQEGIKWPDRAAGRTLAWRERYRNTLNVDATNFVGAAFFFPRLATPIFIAPTLTSNNFPITALGTGVDWADNASNALPVKAFRVVNFGVRIRYIGPALYARGLMTFSTLEGDTTTDFPSTPGEYAIEKQTYAIVPGLDVVWMAKPLSNAAREFYADDATSSTYMSGWSALALFYEGLDSNTTSGLHVEVLAHYEFLPETGGTLVHAATPAAEAKPGLMDAVSNALRLLPSSIEKFGESAATVNQMAQLFRSYKTQPLMLTQF
jgi:hypothetical protein